MIFVYNSLKEFLYLVLVLETSLKNIQVDKDIFLNYNCKFISVPL